MAVHKKYPALGRGLEVLMRTDEVHTGGSSSINEVRISAIHANPNQPRREFDETALKELADSIREIGIIQPITVRDMGDGSFTIIAGERRWRASQMAGLTSIPAYIRTVDDDVGGNREDSFDDFGVFRLDDCAAAGLLDFLHKVGRLIGAGALVSNEYIFDIFALADTLVIDRLDAL
ncbi:MAG: ParB/RepB/Spo0J family partition protein, partial [Bacteroidaceae bacterium]|nr:ParB/RepB/Spo0J family partition protein [Bacteroidaceae bacterium]